MKMVRGGEEEDRTPDLCIANAALSQLSYFPIADNFSKLLNLPVAATYLFFCRLYG